MSVPRLSKREALRLITPVVDDEASRQERSDFLASLEHYPEVARQFRSVQNVKQLIRSRCPREKAPHMLVERIQEIIHEFPADRPGRDL